MMNYALTSRNTVSITFTFDRTFSAFFLGGGVGDVFETHCQDRASVATSQPKTQVSSPVTMFFTSRHRHLHGRQALY
jgi:hypothetical protein